MNCSRCGAEIEAAAYRLSDDNEPLCLDDCYAEFHES